MSDAPNPAKTAEHDILLLRLDAPLLSFGGLAIDERRVTREMPGRSLLTGLLANALGWHHTDTAALQDLQGRLVFAVRQDRRGERLDDYQTVDLGQAHLHQGWTTHGRPEGRKGATSSGTHISRRQYLADAAYTVALRLDPPAATPTLDHLERALRHPARPLFIGRKTCLPSRPLVGHGQQTDRLQAPSVLAALTRAPLWAQAGPPSPRARNRYCTVWWPAGPTAPDPHDQAPEPPARGVRLDRWLAVVDDREWRHQIHGGQRFWFEGAIDLETLGLLPEPAPTDFVAAQGTPNHA